MTQAPAPDQAAALPPFSGDDVECVKCSYTEAFTRYRPASWCLEEHNGRPRTGPLPERLERACARCDFTWDEALFAPLHEKPLIPADAHPSTTGLAAAGGEA
ncbi:MULTISPECIES: hypothetical protein [unclassified Streptomyces]|uniref:hypothetical protein n=1 Tax=unclassified Streptomyces TaxID=2593676 RepID=UPI00093D7264|nr:hypothetical protein [Streptomyces sp. TSRI0281]OKI34981.1 hypothetical protein A6A29_16275 [Streptomyces sp. TSRI0281]